MNRFSPFFIGILTLTLAACATDTANQPVDTDATTSADAEIQETKNVIYRGRLEEAGASIFMQGSHRLVLDDGRFILLESETIDLDDYLNQQVEVFGSVRATVEQGGMIMRVESVLSLEASSSSTSSESSGSSEISLTNESSSATTIEAASSAMAARSSAAAVVTPPASSTAATWEASDELTEKAAIMASVKMGPENWTQQYCSTHIGFCIPVHKNWWFKSFGATTTALWHVEIGPSEMNNLGEGPLTVRLVSGSIDASADGQVQSSDGEVVGMRTWTGSRHFEIRGPANLEVAIRYLTEQLKASEQ